MSARVVIRELRTTDEFHETFDVSKEAWKFEDRVLSPWTDLIAGTHAGGMTAGAFEKGRMLGFVHGLPRTNLGEPAHHSHLLAVRPEAQGRGLSVQLKLFQRDWCLRHGVRIVTWTYDPFLLKNAKLNLCRLRAVVRGFLPNFYGFMGGIYGNLPTDRFEVTWRLDDPAVAAAARGEAPPPEESGRVPVARSGPVPRAPRVALPFPAGAPGIYRSDHDGTLRERKRFAAAARALFAKGYQADGVAVREAGPVYLLTRR
ncbi:MAG TPA: GNAT family N-acetyltransferase [Thermoanaerobaculia bacterium]|nr:GNAT family N-acetyltransferase [Thermoanaerobaculia bacterium]